METKFEDLPHETKKQAMTFALRAAAVIEESLAEWNGDMTTSKGEEFNVSEKGTVSFQTEDGTWVAFRVGVSLFPTTGIVEE